jgi:hypothetical protein
MRTSGLGAMRVPEWEAAAAYKVRLVGSAQRVRALCQGIYGECGGERGGRRG